MQEEELNKTEIKNYDFTRDAKFALFEKYNKNIVLIYIMNIRDQCKLNKWIKSLKNEYRDIIESDYKAAYEKLAKNNYISIEHCKKQYPESFK